VEFGNSKTRDTVRQERLVDSPIEWIKWWRASEGFWQKLDTAANTASRSEVVCGVSGVSINGCGVEGGVWKGEGVVKVRSIGKDTATEARRVARSCSGTDVNISKLHARPETAAYQMGEGTLQGQAPANSQKTQNQNKIDRIHGILAGHRKIVYFSFVCNVLPCYNQHGGNDAAKTCRCRVPTWDYPHLCAASEESKIEAAARARSRQK
jgi:hypothetical protein